MCEAEEKFGFHNFAVSELTGFNGIRWETHQSLFQGKNHHEIHNLSIWSETPPLGISTFNILTRLWFTKAVDYDHMKLQVYNRLMSKKKNTYRKIHVLLFNNIWIYIQDDNLIFNVSKRNTRGRVT